MTTNVRALFFSCLFVIFLPQRTTAQTSLTEREDPERTVVWTMVVIPDTQNLVKNAADVSKLTAMFDWIVANRELRKIAMVLQEGDLVELNDAQAAASPIVDQSGQQQWSHIKEGFSRLDNLVPYILATGNHDYGYKNAENRSTQFNRYFRVGDNRLSDDLRAGMMPDPTRGLPEGSLENAVYDFKAPDDRRMLIFSLEWAPRQRVLDWANGIAELAAYREHTMVLLTHAYVYSDDTLYDGVGGKRQIADPADYAGTNSDTNSGTEVWSKLVKRHPFRLAFSGHVITAEKQRAEDGQYNVDYGTVGYLRDVNDIGQSVHQMLFNDQVYHGTHEGCEAWFRLLEFLDDGKTIHVKTFTASPDNEPWRVGPRDDFYLSL